MGRTRLASLPLPVGHEGPADPARLPRRQHRPRSDHRMVRPPPAPQPGRSPPARPDPTCWTSTTAARPPTGSPPWPGCVMAGLLDGAAGQRPHPRRRRMYFAGIRPAHRPPARRPRRLPRRRRLRPASRRRRSAESPTSSPGARRPRRPGLGRRRPPPATLPRPASARHPAARVPATASRSARWPAGSPPSPKATATPACSGPPTAPWKPTRPPTSAPWPPPPARPGSPTRRSARTLDSARRTAQARPEPPGHQPEGAADMTSTPRRQPAGPARPRRPVPLRARPSSATRCAGCAPKAAPTGPSRPPPAWPPPPSTTSPPAAASPPRPPPGR